MKRKQKAFTLAEVLMVLGVLGVIAMMTLPTLSADVRGTQLAATLRTTQASISDKLDAAMALEDVNDIRDLQAFSATTKAELYNGLSKYLRLDKIGSDHVIRPISGSTETTWEAADIKQTNTGAYIYISDFSELRSDKLEEINASHGALLRRNAIVFIDVNAEKKPNRLGYDVFQYYLAQDGRLYPVGGRDVSLFLSGNPTASDWTASGETSCSKENGDGYGCAGRVEDEEWKMKYISTKGKVKVSQSGGEETDTPDETPETTPET